MEGTCAARDEEGLTDVGRGVERGVRRSESVE